MKKIVHINSVNFGSTGKIMLQIHDACKERNYSSYVSYPKSRDNLNKKCDDAIIIGNRYFRNLHIWLAKFTGFNGCFSCVSTLLFLKKIKKISPDIIHLHNLHNCYINLPLLFKYIKKKNVPVVWTLHDCWAFTGQCPHFTIAKCDKWKMGCHDCPSYSEYPESYVDRTKVMWKLKKKWFTGVKDLTIVTPSQWLADLVKESFLKEYSVKVINNGIDLSVFQPTESDFRKKYGIPQNKKILLGVALGWGRRKGLDVFIELANRLENNEYQIVLVGTDDGVDQQIPKNIISIHRTQDQKELAEIYSSVDLFVNPTREEVLGMVNIEANACGTPVLTFRTGGSPECIDAFSGSVVRCDDIDSMEKEIKRICEYVPYSIEACVERAKAFEMNERFKEYIALYEAII